MKAYKTPQKKPGRKGTKVRSHVTLSENLNAAADFIGKETFGNKTAYLEHLIMNDLKEHRLTLPDLFKLADERREKREKK